MKTKLYFLGLLVPLIANAATYNLENFSTSLLSGQDGWTGDGPIQVATGTGFNTSNVLTSNAPGTPQINRLVVIHLSVMPYGHHHHCKVALALLNAFR